MNERLAERIREAQETIEVLRKVHPANHPDVTQIADFFELHAAHERKQGRTENAERAAQRAVRLREDLSPAKGLTCMKNATRSDGPRGSETRSRGDNPA